MTGVHDRSAATEHVPEVWVDCSECCGEGEIIETIHVYESGCGFSHPDVYGKPCPVCYGTRGMICEAEGDEI
jgi:hypothetical protein